MRLTGILVATIIAASTLLAQEPTRQPPTPKPEGDAARGAQSHVPREALRIAYYRPDSSEVDLAELERAASRLFGRKLLVTTAGEAPSSLDTVQRVGNALAIIDEPTNVERILAALPELERRAFGTGEAPTIAKDAIRQQIFDVGAQRHQLVMQALELHRRKIPTSDGQGAVVNIASAGKNSIIIRDTAENIARMAAVIEGLAQGEDASPEIAKSVVLSCLLIATGDAAKDCRRVGEELAGDLRRLLPYDEFGIAAVSLAHVATPANQVSIALDGARGVSGVLRLRSCRYATNPERMTIEALSFQMQLVGAGPEAPPTALELETRADIAFGEDVVIGAMGKSPYLLVLRATPR